MPEFTNKVALVTGGSRDIGRAISLRLAELGARVAVNYHHSRADADETLRLIAAAGGQAIAVQGDVTQSADTEHLMREAATAFGGRIDILVNNAGGIVARKTVAEMDAAFWDQVIALNLRSVFLATKAVLPVMPDGGAIVNLASQAARDGGGGGASAYAAAKAGVLNFTRSMAKELAARRIRVNAVNPGMIATAFHDTHTKPEIRQRVAGATPLGREGRAAEVADLVAYLASGRASFLNGEAVEINGGAFFN